jgi:magnesium chelatase family protein
MSPCPYGHLQDAQKLYMCVPAVVTKYQKRISSPPLDCLDVHIEAPRKDDEKLSGDRIGEPSECIRARVYTASALAPHGSVHSQKIVSNDKIGVTH